jgi:hypothetical protein
MDISVNDAHAQPRCRRRGGNACRMLIVVLLVCAYTARAAGDDNHRAGTVAVGKETAVPATLADRLIRGYRQIRSLTCSIRKTTKGEGTLRLLSRVAYEQPNRIHVENASPFRRRIVCDGRALYYYQAGHPKGFSLPVNRLEGPWLANTRSIPATPMEHLLHLAGRPETVLPATETSPLRREYLAAGRRVVLACDSRGRLLAIRFFKPEDTSPLAVYTYDRFVEAGPDCWIPTVHKGRMTLPDGKETTVTTRIDDLQLNGALAPSTFDPRLYFQDVVFTTNFQETLPPPPPP